MGSCGNWRHGGLRKSECIVTDCLFSLQVFLLQTVGYSGSFANLNMICLCFIIPFPKKIRG